MSLHPARLSISLSLLLGLAVSAASARDLSDPFDLDTAERRPGGALDGTLAGAGGPAWKAAEIFIFEKTGAGSRIAIEDGRFGSARIPLAAAGDTIELTLDVLVTSDRVGWIAVGVAPDDSVSDINFGGGLFLYLDSKGDSQVRANGLAIRLASGRVHDFRPGALNRLHLAYDRTARTIVARVNETLIADRVPVADFTPGTAFAGFSNFGTNGDARVDNFSLTVR